MHHLKRGINHLDHRDSNDFDRIQFREGSEGTEESDAQTVRVTGQNLGGPGEKILRVDLGFRGDLKF